MKTRITLRRLFFPALVLYSIVLSAVALFSSENVIRYFMTDLVSTCPNYSYLPFFGINTTFSVFLLWAAALLFLLAQRCLKRTGKDSAEELFLVSQFLMFLYLGCDDRLLIHERLSDTVGMKDALFFAGLGLLELFFLLRWGKLPARSLRQIADVLAAGFFFCVMVAADVLLPHNFQPRLAIEDLAKLWSAVFLFKFAWDVCIEKIETLKKGAYESS